jgi:hypothetical protein
MNAVPVNGRCSVVLNVEGYLKTLVATFPGVIFLLLNGQAFEEDG